MNNIANLANIAQIDKLEHIEIPGASRSKIGAAASSDISDRDAVQLKLSRWEQNGLWAQLRKKSGGAWVAKYTDRSF